MLGLRRRRQAGRRRCPASGDVLLFARSQRRAPAEPSRQWSGAFQADASTGYDNLYASDHKPGPIRQVSCWARARRPSFIFADLEEAARRKALGKKPVVVSPVALEVVGRLDALFDIEREIKGEPPEKRRAVRPALDAHLKEKQLAFSRLHDLHRAIRYLLKRSPAFALFLDDGRVCLCNNAAERALRGIALCRKSWLFCGSDRGGQQAEAVYSLIVTAKMNYVDPHAWLANLLARIACNPAHRIDERLSWNWKSLRQEALAAQAA